MNLELFFLIIAWGAILVSGIVNLINLLKVIVYIVDDKIHLTRVSYVFFVWIGIFITSLVYIIAT